LSHEYEVLATSFSWPWHMRAGDQSYPSPYHLPTDSILIIVVQVMHADGAEILNQISGGDLKPSPLAWQSSMLITAPSSIPDIK